MNDRAIPVTLSSEGECLYPCDGCDELVCDLASVDGDLLCVSCLRKKFASVEAERDRLKKALRQIASGTEDMEPPFRCLPRSELMRIAYEALPREETQ